ncbi:D-tyrosyl-tRNA(Tyr) deacylase [Magnetococcus marinus MC-1]|uniref:D-aminoacyl-tRNA deacylase n=1 Tax=Magnetococcus marinus (strain ATCC BAA-1437 / JCM 17883 / MC-1) TaxID=156889 RepID=DTD_MAGMM|nr:D-aminoacyl-tRNA deacylase [Magnetococcus marinus]A0L7S8.1 RecName: Full=D-aminoacyl-tRNA deacylase; Short=DTD; AltName: Full=Gly-tRNA(Ala) deacylase [Magnetococcus marinus MC-1]ABK44021.1 D-tyrosyl-tRNA(Tyr) deacylase [Magnetococcus marinus MC-1]
MRALVQRVSEASVVVEGQVVGAVERGLLVLLAVERGDGEKQLEEMVRKVARLRIFPDEAGKMNLSVKDIEGEVLVVSQFTLAADMRKGYRPSFSLAEEPKRAEALYLDYCQRLNQHEGVVVAQGLFGADMQVKLINDGPVTIWLDLPPQEG